MSRSSETEIKLEIPSLPALRRRLRDLGFLKVRARHFESNTLFDFPSLSLWKAHCLLRLRQSDGQWLVTYKGTPRASAHYKIRREIETIVEDGTRLRGILEALGLRPVFRYEKYRTVFAPRRRRVKQTGPLVILDETPIGNYLELEGPESWIDRVARRLGYQRENYITASYASLYRQKCAEQGVKPTNMVFSQSKS